MRIHKINNERQRLFIVLNIYYIYKGDFKAINLSIDFIPIQWKNETKNLQINNNKKTINSQKDTVRN